MRIRSLQLEQFRSYRQLSLPLGDSNIHLFVGANGAGKTNILESIAVLSLTKSGQGLDEPDLVEWEQQYFRVRADVLSDSGEEGTLEVVSQLAPKKQKACFKNDVRLGMNAMVGILPTCLFLPQELHLFSGSPQDRRSFLDRLLCQVSPEYLETLLHYQRVLKQRNALLRRIAERVAGVGDLAVWDQYLSDAGASITLHRLELLSVLQCSFAEELSNLGESWKDPLMKYERKCTAHEKGALAAELRDLLLSAQQKDIALQSTTVGPHRDDWQVYVEGRPLYSFASRGQQRTAVLALLLLEVAYLELRRGERPIILLDDVFSELDDRHQTLLLHALTNHQVIITATHLPSDTVNGQVWHVEGEGRVLKDEVPVTSH